MKLTKKCATLLSIAIFSTVLTACSSGTSVKAKSSKTVKASVYQPSEESEVSDKGKSSGVVRQLEAIQREWKNTPYRLGGTTKKGIDCSAFTQMVYRRVYGVELPRMTVDQAKQGRQVRKSDLKAGDLVAFKTGRGPNGRHIGVYVKNGEFMHASTRGGVIFSRLDNVYWSKAYWQARRL
ncbi:endopeptidase [Haemophilus paracuniculus]|uniref:Endopeptidase n=1 Tax=Haemophilus paracuniculus TaxID=734 RepID=A0A1T0ARP9_9PAST|nr:NlpC/P60 family protein [Haemophilus paracuniculus]OOR99182.1 endopeptidase [Haemophilus paracuniculus]